MLDERTRRLWAATEAKTIGYGGQTIVSVATGLSRTTISTELKRLKNKDFSETQLDSPKFSSLKISSI